MMDILRIAAFTDGARGGNPAGVVLADALPDPARMQAVAREVGYSETVFAAREHDGWRARYFAPEREVPFCGHATIALGAALARAFGDGVYPLALQGGAISVEARHDGDALVATLQSPPTANRDADAATVDAALALFGYDRATLDQRLEPALAEAGARFLILPLRSRASLAAMRYDLAAGRAFMDRIGAVTVMLVVADGERGFHARNAFASGGVYEDPATGAAAAAFAGLLAVRGRAAGSAVEIRQGDDMGVPCRIVATLPARIGGSARVSGTARFM